MRHFIPLVFCALVGTIQADDITERLVDLGNKPAESGKRGVSLNVWDLQVFDGKIYIGMGSTSADSGPHPVWAFGHAAGRWDETPETIVGQEAIELYRVIDDRLYIPAADPKGSATEASKFYRRDLDGVWTHFFSTRAFHMAHIRDLALADDLLVGVGNSRRPHDLTRAKTSAVAVPLIVVDILQDSDREMLEFQSAISLVPPAEGGLVDADTSQRNRMANWFFSIFRLHDGLYASTRWLSWAPDHPEPVGMYASRAAYPPQVPPFPAVVRWDSGLKEWVAPDPATLDRLVPESPGRNIELTLRPYKSALFGELWFTPLRSYGLNQADYDRAYNQSADFVVKPADGPGLRVVLPDAEALGEAVLLHQGRLYVLANARQSDGGYRVVVYALDRDDARDGRLDPETGLALDVWEEVLSFRSSNLARSFARIDDTWYFGLGVAHGEPVGKAGTLLRYTAGNGR